MSDPGPADAIAAIEELVGLQARLVSTGIKGRRGGFVDKSALVLGLCSQAHALAEATLPLWSSATTGVAIAPVARSVYECGLLAQWVTREPDSVRSVVLEGVRQRALLADELERSSMNSHAAAIRATIAAWTGMSGNVALRPGSIRWLCDQFADGGDLYSYYRILCGFTHGGLQAADQWLIWTGDEMHPKAALRQRLEPDQSSAFLVAMGLLFTASAVGDVLNPSRSYQNALNRIASRLQIRRRLLLKVS